MPLAACLPVLGSVVTLAGKPPVVPTYVGNPSFDTTAQSPSVAPVGGYGFRVEVTQGSLRFALGFTLSPLRGWISLALHSWNPVNKTTLRCSVKLRRSTGMWEISWYHTETETLYQYEGAVK